MQTILLDGELTIDVHTIKKAALVYRAINNKLRQQILYLLIQRQELAVTEIYVALRIEQSVASQHLAVLRREGIVQTKRDGKKIYYSINEARINQLHQISKMLIGR